MTTDTAAPVLAGSPVLIGAPTSTPAWWSQLERKLASITASGPTRRAFEPIDACRRIAVRFGLDVDTDAQDWRPSHGRLDWRSIRTQPPVLVDRGPALLAPRGYDAACLLGTALAVPEVADEVAHRFSDDLDTADGVFSQLVVLASLLARADAGEHLELVTPIHRHVDHLLGRPTVRRPPTA
ncbi:hypothetical protein SRABI76_03170 [Microbacterium oxydans]|uniref:hypothetical protein n=1 Tax=Microbacterium oxydans TaxID=82380 RepID=UPI001DB0DDD1|nr:hypothetical protein [Microbacterium oxydans]CAH0248078.1 hypothetical protein SRABI76_03170 [Microbacterium oxydans]